MAKVSPEAHSMPKRATIFPAVSFGDVFHGVGMHAYQRPTLKRLRERVFQKAPSPFLNSPWYSRT
jgi:hypothetical protein